MCRPISTKTALAAHACSAKTPLDLADLGWEPLANLDADFIPGTPRPARPVGLVRSKDWRGGWLPNRGGVGPLWTAHPPGQGTPSALQGPESDQCFCARYRAAPGGPYRLDLQVVARLCVASGANFASRVRSAVR
eukprot:m.106559 g.106559  ORF g.106559 m.106559 type:complete len:135 (-) comp51678_c1_seq2:84-488(-)